MSNNATHRYSTRTALRSRTNTTTTSSTSIATKKSTTFIDLTVPTTRSAAAKKVANNKKSKSNKNSADSSSANNNNSGAAVLDAAGATRANMAVRSSELPRADASSSHRKRKIEQQVSFLAPSEAATSTATQFLTNDAAAAAAAADNNDNNSNNNNVSTCTSSPVAKLPRLDDAAHRLLSQQPSSTAAVECIVLTDDVVSVDEVSFELKRGNVPDKRSPTFEFQTPYRPPMRNAQQTLTLSAHEICTPEDELECIDETAALMQKRGDFYAPSPSWLSAHPELKPSMRAILLDWLRELSCPDGGYKLHRSTYHTAVNVFDRFMSRRANVPRTKVQLIGSAVLLIASKLEESYRSPNIETLLFYCDGLYQRHELLAVEALILRTLDWRVTPPTPFDFAKLIISRMFYTELLGKFPGRTDLMLDGENSELTLHRELPRAPLRRIWIVESMQLLDTAVLDNESMRFRTHTLAIAALACTHIKDTDKTPQAGLEFVLEHWEPQLPETKAAVAAAAAAQQSMPRTPALVSNRSNPRQQTVTSEQLACVRWMQTYIDVALIDSSLWTNQDEIFWIDYQDWNKNSLDFVRQRLRERTLTNGLPTRVLSHSFAN